MRLVFGPDEPLIHELEAASLRHEGGVFWIAVAWAREPGVLWLEEAVDGRLAEIHAVVGVNERGTTVEALLRLMALCDSVHVLYKHPRQTFHPKIFEFTGGDAGPEAATLMVGSSNLTHGGLVTNFEASLLVEAGAALIGTAAGLTESEFASELTDTDGIRALYDEGLIVLERRLRRERRERGRGVAAQPTGRPTAPPPPIQPPIAMPIDIPFPIAPDEPGEVPEDEDPVGVPPHSGRFYVRTLTANDVGKLLGDPGTFEPDLGEMARDQYPAFWGWPHQYATVVRQLPRDEWAATGRLTSSASPGGVDVEVMLWYRPERPGHAAEHRLRLGPIGQVRQAVPAGFDVNGVLVVTRAPDGAGRDFDLRLISVGEPDHAGYAAHLAVNRPAHRFGYGV